MKLEMEKLDKFGLKNRFRKRVEESSGRTKEKERELRKKEKERSSEKKVKKERGMVVRVARLGRYVSAPWLDSSNKDRR